MLLVLQVFSYKPKYWANLNSGVMTALEEKSGDHQSHSESFSGDHECLYTKPWQSHLIVVKVIQPGPRRWDD